MSPKSNPMLAPTDEDRTIGSLVQAPEEEPIRDLPGRLREHKASEPENPHSASFRSSKSALDLKDLQHRLVARRAYEKWEAKGRPSGSPLQDWLEAEAEVGHVPVDASLLPCPFLVEGRLLSGKEALICINVEGSCPLQEMVPTTGGRHTAICKLPLDAFRKNA